MVKFLEESGWDIIFGLIREDEKGEYMFTGRRENTVIDYVIGDEKMRERIRRLEVEEEGGNQIITQ